MVKVQLDAFEAYSRDGNQVKERFLSVRTSQSEFIDTKPIKRLIQESQLLVKICWLTQKLFGVRYRQVFCLAWKKSLKDQFESLKYLLHRIWVYKKAIIHVTKPILPYIGFIIQGIRTLKGTEELIQSDEVQSAVDDVVSAFDEIKNAFKGFINVNCDDLGQIRETAYQGPK